MVENKKGTKLKFLDKWFGETAKLNKAKTQLKKLKQEHDKLDSKLESSTISKKELDRYYILKEEIIMAAKKFTLKDGKLVLTESISKETPAVAPQSVAPQPVVDTQIAQQQAALQAQQQAELQAQQVAQQQAQQQAELQAQQQAELQAQQQAELQAQQQAEQLQAQQQAEQLQAQQQAEQLQAQQQQVQPSREEMMQQINENRARQMEEYKRQQVVQQQAAQEQVAQEQPVHQGPPGTSLYVKMFVQDMPELAIPIIESKVKMFMTACDEAIKNKDTFKFNDFYIVAAHILAYKFEYLTD